MPDSFDQSLECAAQHVVGQYFEVLNVRPAHRDDIGRVVTIHQAARLSYYRLAGYEPNPTKKPEPQEWTSHLGRPGMYLACVCRAQNPETIGFACAYDGQEAGRGGLWSVELVGLYVDPDHWGLGAGSALHNWYLSILRASSTAEAGTLYVWSRNSRARRFYEQRGWSDQGSAYPGPMDAAFISMRLQP